MAKQNANAAAEQDVGLLTITVAMPPAVVRALRSAARDRAVDRIKPYTQRDIVTAALTDWLKREGYWPETV